MTAQSEPILTLVVRSAAFAANGLIPIEHALEGLNIPPPMSWGAVPAGTRSVAVIVEDPDAPGRTFVHYLVTAIPPEIHQLRPKLPEGAVAGTNDHGTTGWFGPNPPSGRHRYIFKVFALDNLPSVPAVTKYDFYTAIKGHVLAQGELIGTYERKSRGVPLATHP